MPHQPRFTSRLHKFTLMRLRGLACKRKFPVSRPPRPLFSAHVLWDLSEGHFVHPWYPAFTGGYKDSHSVLGMPSESPQAEVRSHHLKVPFMETARGEVELTSEGLDLAAALGLPTRRSVTLRIPRPPTGPLDPWAGLPRQIHCDFLIPGVCFPLFPILR
ncbi:hypothetical protein C8R43DRAFT_465674 [Mycena crocata]|nr:hypothetical protein C8R43DRAFT_465674 [Mycena crocata]